MNKYCFELYKKFGIENIFMGYKIVNAESVENAKNILTEKFNDGYQLAQIYLHNT